MAQDALPRAARPLRLIRPAGGGWATLLGFLLLLLSGNLYFQSWLSSVLGWPILWPEAFLLQLLLYLWLSFLCALFVGGFRARLTGQANHVLRLCVRAEVIAIVPVMVLSEAIGFSWGPLVSLAAHSELARHLVSFGDDMAPLEFIVDGVMLAPILGGLQLLVSAGGTKSGGWIGNRLRQPQQRDPA